jgi:beta-lactamase regulating signal transducer with metallopeptidase domain
MLNALLWNLALTAVLAIALAALCRLPSLARRPALRHWLWLLVLVKLVTPPLVAVPLLPAVADLHDAVVVAAASVSSAERRELALAPPTPMRPAVDETVSGRAGRDLNDLSPSEPPRPAGVLVLGGLLAVSLIGTCLLLTVHAVRAVKLYRWLRRAGTENSQLVESCAEVASSLAVRRVVRSCVVDARTTPLLWAWREPLVVVPRQFLDDLSPQQLRSVVAHELAHLVRRDHWANLFVFLVKALLWWNPVVWWADRELRAAQELCCDAIAIDCCKANRRSYAATLLKALDFIQAEPLAPRALATGMGSKVAILRRFEMIGDTRLTYQLSGGTFFLLLVLALPLVCIPVRGQEKGSAATGTAAAAAAAGKKEAAAKPAPKKTAADADAWPVDPKVKELGQAVLKRMNAWSDTETMVLKNGQAGLMKLKKNVTPVAQIRITPHFAKNGTKFDLEGVDATGKTIQGTKQTSSATSTCLGKSFSVDGKDIMCMIQLPAVRRDGDHITVDLKVLFMPVATTEELEAMLLTMGKRGRVMADFQSIYRWAWEYKNLTGHYPRSSKEFKKPWPKDVYSPTGEDYHYEAHQHGYIVSSCGKDGIHGNADDVIQVVGPEERTSGCRREFGSLEKLGPLADRYPPGKDEEFTVPQDEDKGPESPKETVNGVRPQGNCSISGKVVSATTGKPIKGAQVYLFYNVTFGSIFLNTASDGTFVLKNIPKGPFSLRTTHVVGCQDAVYDPEGRPGPFPAFSLEDGEHRSGIVLKAKQACRVSGKILDEQGDVPDNVDTLRVLAWFKEDDGKNYKLEQTRVKAEDGSYLIDGLSEKPVYVMAINWQAAGEGSALPPIYYPGTFFRNDAKLITFDKARSVGDINITLRKEGGLILEGTVRDDTGKPVPEAFVVVHRRDMLFDFVTAYTDNQGHYQIQGLGDGHFQAHVDAMHRGLVRTRAILDLVRAQKKTQRDFTLIRGVSISGKFVDQKGKGWRIGESHGYANLVDEQRNQQEPQHYGSFTLTGFGNKYRPHDSVRASGVSFSLGAGNYREGGRMLFPTKSTFLIQGLMPGHTVLSFSPQKEKQTVLKILHNGHDIMKSGIDTKPGQEIKDITIVIGTR